MRISDWDSDVCSSDLADIVLQGFGGGTAAKLGIDAERLMGLNSRIIYCDISGYGRDGPLGNQPGYDVMLQAFSGMLSTMGEPKGNYARASFSPVDNGSAMFGLSGVLAALRSDEHTSELQSLLRTSSAVFHLKKTSQLTHT